MIRYLAVGALVLMACGDDGNHGAANDAAACTPPTGYETPIARGDTSAPAGVSHVSLALSAYDEPLVAWIGGSQLWFMRWDASTCAWQPPVTVDTVGDYSDLASSANDSRQIKLARDVVDSHLAIAYVKVRTVNGVAFQDVQLAQSADSGATWTTELVASASMSNAADNLSSPSVAIVAGMTAVTYFQSYADDPSARCGSPQCDSMRIAERNGTSGTFALQTIPPTSDADGMFGTLPLNAEVAFDNDLHPGVAWAENADTVIDIAYWHGGASSQIVLGAGALNSTFGVSMIYDNDVPRVAATTQQQAQSTDHDVWFAAGADLDGTSWATVQLPADEPKILGPYVSLASDQAAHYSIASDFAGAATSDVMARCGGPNLSSSADGTTWTTCGTDDGDAYMFAGDYVSLAVQLDGTRLGKRVLAFAYATADTGLAPGLVVWREP
jgi:hypothetical protein